MDYGRPSLALDLLEEFRQPLVDRFTLSLVNLRVLTLADFYRDGSSNGVYLTPDGLKTYCRHYERWMHEEVVIDGTERLSYRRCFQRQAQRMADALRTDTPYMPSHLGG